MFLHCRRIIAVPVWLVLFWLSVCGLRASGVPEMVSAREVVTSPVLVTATVGPGGTGTADYDLGSQLYLANCTGCHGAQDGVGPALTGMAERAATRTAGQSAADYLRESIINPGAVIVEGYSDSMRTTFGQQFSEFELNSLVKFILEFTPSSTMTPTPPSTPAPGLSPAASVLTVRGKLIQGTAGGPSLPPNLPVELHVFNTRGERVELYNTMADANGVFVFKNVVRASRNIYYVQVIYAGLPQGAQIAHIEGNEEELSINVKLYERTTDTSSVMIRQMQMLVNYAPINQFGLEIRLDLVLVTTGDRIVYSDQLTPEGLPVSVSLELPVGAFSIRPMQMDNAQRYSVQMVNSIPIVQDTWPIGPAQPHTITIFYYLPYTDGAVLDQALGYPVMSGSILLPNDTVTLESDQFDTQGEFRYQVSPDSLEIRQLDSNTPITSDTDPTLIKAYDLLRPLSGHERLIFTLVGRPSRTINLMTPTPNRATESKSNFLPILLAGLGTTLMVLAGALWWYQRKTIPKPPKAWSPPRAGDKNALLRAIAELDDAYEAGRVDTQTYQEQRAMLKERLIPLMKDRDD